MDQDQEANAVATGVSIDAIEARLRKLEARIDVLEAKVSRVVHFGEGEAPMPTDMDF